LSINNRPLLKFDKQKENFYDMSNIYCMHPSDKSHTALMLDARLATNTSTKLAPYTQQYFSKITDFIPDIIYIYDLKIQKTLFVNKSLTSILGYTQEDFMNGTVNWYDIIHPTDQKDAPNVLSKILKLLDTETIEYDIRCLTINGSYIWLHNKLTIFIRGLDNEPEQVLVTAQDISTKKKMEEKLTTQAYTDHLTGIANRTRFMEILEDKVNTGDSDFAILFLDLNQFKEVNDIHGHEIGDKVIIKAAKRLTKVFGKPHIVARLGGDEFTVIIDKCTNDIKLEKYIQNVKSAFIKVFKLGKINLSMSVSIGSVLANTLSKPSPSKLLQHADKSMYLEKKKLYQGQKVPKRREVYDTQC
jgi:diguanylate cyclase (GGDEF)-like protein/PAS domain S-box-containing protein